MISTFLKENKSFFYLWLAQVFSQVAISILNFVLALLVYNETRSNLAVSFLLIAYGLPAFLFGMLSGVLVDRWNKKKTMIMVNLLRTAAVIAFLVFPKGILLITLFFAFIMSAFTQFFFPAEGATIPSVVKRKDLLTANSLYSATFFVSQVFGYLLAGVLLNTFHQRIVLVILAALFFLSTVFVSRLKVGDNLTIFYYLKSLFHIKKRYEFSVFKEVLKDLKGGLIYIRTGEKIYNALILMGLSQIFSGVFISLLPGLGVEVLGLKTEDISLILMGPAVFGMMLGAILTPKLTSKIKNLMNFGLLGGAVFFILLSFIRRMPFDRVKQGINLINFMPLKNFLGFEYNKFLGIDLIVYAIVVMVFIGMFNAFVVVTGNTVLQSEGNEKNRGKIYGVLQTVVNVAGFFPLILGGAAADRFGVVKVIGSIGVIILIAGILNLKCKLMQIT